MGFFYNKQKPARNVQSLIENTRAFPQTGRMWLIKAGLVFKYVIVKHKDFKIP